MKDITGASDIQLLVDHFFERARRDALLGEMFAHVADPHIHKQQLCAFWEAALLGSGGFDGELPGRHGNLDLSIQHFIRWRTLFFETLNAHFAGPNCERARVLIIRQSEELLSQLELSRF